MAAIQVMAVTRAEAGIKPRSELISVGHKLGGTVLRQYTIDWGATDKCKELRNFRLEVNNIFQTCNIKN